MAAGRIREAGLEGVDSIRVIDRAGDFGGTWYWNWHPGAMSDVESYIYMPLLEELDYVPAKYAHLVLSLSTG
ncbi:cation diffusion facilitator CzcD-associated flavoprotein CzcO [Rhodococcus opacus]|nr:cation diffusion facilitator CzcD-associated flavoprotein CzcO [Rhodococcus opacus]